MAAAATRAGPDAGREGHARAPWGRLALLLLACALLRGWLILAPPDDFFERGEVPHEELLRGVAAADILDGALAPIQGYQANNMWGGSLVVSLLATVPYSILGVKLYALRLVALAIGLACVLLLFLVLQRHASPRAAWVGAALLAFAPPGYAMSSCTLYGTHVEANALALLVVLLVLEEQRQGGRRPWLGFALGAAAGFALWFGFSMFPVLCVWLLHELACDRLFFLRRRALALALGFMTGFSPWIRYQLVQGWSGFRMYEGGATEHALAGLRRGQAAEKLFAAVARDGPLSFAFRDTLAVPGLWAGRVLLVLFAAAAVRALWLMRADIAALWAGLRGAVSARATPGTLAVAYLALFGALYCVSIFDPGGRDWIFDLRYLMPPVPFACLLAGLAVADWAARGRRARTAAWAAVCAVVLTCGVATARHARPARIESSLQESGTSHERLVRFLVLRFSREQDFVTIADRIVARRAPPERERLLAEFGRGLRRVAALPTQSDEDVRRKAACAQARTSIAARLPADLRAVFLGPE